MILVVVMVEYEYLGLQTSRNVEWYIAKIYAVANLSRFYHLPCLP